ncbi:ABC transporter ATP-binding protein [Zavarzinia aquatilis]|uniref:Sulfonate ABC transporter ATP-binding protein n=1 Tax=Zavarzinia aquatilis TaxID=2211142 RepID=A0A317DXQ1_9PROT|nr:ABC transporter ATP-binding protein [Zavarzinia aquatilis]PWR19507.1 sulfonate ABC transporter ATP-binding protein [Zavarzinia aquatilis]
MSQAKLSLDQVRLEYRTAEKTVLAIDGVSFDVPENQFAVIVGPSGCGKSSLLYLIAGLSERTGGDIRLDGREVDGPGPDRGMVFQSYTLFPWLTVRQNVEFGLVRRKVPAAERERIVDGYLNATGLAQFHDSYPKELSGGMMQRVAIIRALANDPEILLMDEPFGALDAQTRITMQQLLLKVWEASRKTVLFVTHDIDEAVLLADRVYVMSARPGRLKAVIDIPLARPRHPDAALEPEFLALKRRIQGLLGGHGDGGH